MTQLAWCSVFALGLGASILLVVIGMLWGAHIIAKSLGLDKLSDWLRNR